jgi:hypothetical protein
VNIPSPCLEEAAQIVRGHQVGAELDAGFDAGEFSGPAHESMLDSELRELAARYDVDLDELRSAVLYTEMTEDEVAAWGDSQERP